ncbi:hypothetical protein ACFL59_14070 [Planctomycetota bacterium]
MTATRHLLTPLTALLPVLVLSCTSPPPIPIPVPTPPRGQIQVQIDTLRISVRRLIDATQKATPLLDTLTDQVRSSFASGGRFAVIERKTGAADQVSISGKGAEVDAVVVGTVTSVLSEKEQLTIDFQVMNVANSEVIYANEYMVKDADVTSAIADIQDKFPKASGTVLARSKETIKIDIGKKHGLLPNMWFVVSAKGSTRAVVDEKTGKVLSAKKIVGRGRITAVREGQADGVLLTDPGENARAADIVEIM